MVSKALELKGMWHVWCTVDVLSPFSADSSSEITMTPRPTETEINFILDAIAEYLTVRVRRTDVLSAWSGIRPLAVDPNAKDTASASRDHIVSTDPDGLITVTGMSLAAHHIDLPPPPLSLPFFLRHSS